MAVTPDANAIITLAEIREYLAIKNTDTSADDFLQRWINEATRALEQKLRGPVVEQTFTEIYNGSGSSKLVVNKKPITALATPAADDLEYRTHPKNAWQTLEADEDLIFIDPKEPWYIYLYSNTFPAGVQNIQVAYKAGYATIPGEIRRAATEMVAEMFHESKHGTGRLGQQARSKSIQGGSSTDSFYELCERHSKLLAPYIWYMP
jgi:uncharacterized phiE125 gp8 family phage protein